MPGIRRLVAFAALAGALALAGCAATGMESESEPMAPPPAPVVAAPPVPYKDCWDGSSVPAGTECPPRAYERESAAREEEEEEEEFSPNEIVAACLRAETCIGVNVLFGTNREVVFGQETETFNRFGGSPATPFKTANGGALVLGETFITVPAPERRQAGRINRPVALFGQRIGVRLDPERHFVFVDYGRLGRQDFAQRINDADSAFVFIHGFNVSFKNAAMRAAQLKVDGGFDGQAMIYSWPTQHNRRLWPGRPYAASQRAAEAARTHFRDFLDLIRAETDSRKVHIVAHSMGNYMMMEVLAALREEAERAGEDGPIFGDIIFAAPDVDRDAFISLARRIDGLGRGMTLYASSRDVSMDIARQLCRLDSGARCPPRAGDVPDAGPIILTQPQLDTIDASNLPNRFFLPTDEHDYFGGDIQILRDITALMRTGRRAPRLETLNEARTRNGRYWIFPCAAGYC